MGNSYCPCDWRCCCPTYLCCRVCNVEIMTFKNYPQARFTFGKKWIHQLRWCIYTDVQFWYDIENKKHNISELMIFKMMIKNLGTGDAVLLDSDGKIIFFIEMNKKNADQETIIHQEPDIPSEKITKFQPIIEEIMYKPGGSGSLAAKKDFYSHATKLEEKKIVNPLDEVDP